MDDPNTIDEPLKAVIAEYQADVFLYSSDITRPNARVFTDWVKTVKVRKPNAYLILTTRGGDPDAAFIIARCLKSKYKHVTVGIFGMCKSAGTLIAIGADSISMDDCGELGPLDIQLGKDDEINKRSSGLDLTESINFLKDLSWAVFTTSFLKLKQGTSITTKTAAEIAQKLSTGMVEPIASQIDPIRLGEIQRSLRIASEYGKLLNPQLDNDKLRKIITHYPSHSYVIDRDQAKELLDAVREITACEIKLKNALAAFVSEPSDVILYLTPSHDDSATQPTEQPPQLPEGDARTTRGEG